MRAGASGRRGGRGFRFAKAQSATHRGEWPELVYKELDTAGIAVFRAARPIRDGAMLPALCLLICLTAHHAPVSLARLRASRRDF